jgi:transcription antitermination factor NusG
MAEEMEMEGPEECMLWYALHVRTRFEKVVARNLQAKGYQEYLPLYRRTSRWSDRVKQLELPLFPGYVFCRFNPSERMPILTVPGVNAVVGFGKVFIPVDETELNAVRTVIESGKYCEPWPFLQVGQRVRVEHGSLTGTEGFVMLVKSTYRLVISINILQRSVGVEIDRDCLKPIPQATVHKKPTTDSVLVHPSAMKNAATHGLRR